MLDEKILVVDDDIAILEILEEFLKRAGYEPRCFLDAQDSITSIRHEKYDLAIVDLKLGIRNGLEVMKAFHENNPDMPVIILTGFGTVESAVEAMDLGAFSYFTKPIKKDELLFEVKRAMEKSRLQSEIARLKKAVTDRGIPELLYTKGAEGVNVRPYNEAKNEFESQYLTHLIDVCGGDVRRAAKEADVSEDEFLQLLRKHGISFKEKADE